MTTSGGSNEAGPSWPERFRAARDLLLTSPGVQRSVAGFPLTRPFARRQVRELFDICAGFVYSQVLFACVKLRLFDMLAAGPQDIESLAGRMALAPEAADRLLRGAVALGLADRRENGRYGLGPRGAAIVANPGIAAMVEHHALLYADLADPVGLLRGEGGPTALSKFWAYSGAENPSAIDAAGVAEYTALMAASQQMLAEQILAACPLHARACLLDVGGGDGSFLAAAAARFPHLRLMLFDLPAVAALASERFANAGIADRASAIGGDFRSDPLPDGADAISLIRVIHDHDDATALALLKSARRVLPARGVLILAEPMSETSGAEPVGDAYFNFYLLATGKGRPRTEAELRALLDEAGFAIASVAQTALPLLVRVIVAGE